MKNKVYILAGLIILIVILIYSLYTPLYHNPISQESFQDYKVKIYRDNWGVPHIVGNKDKDSIYGLAFAHAEDDFNTIQDIILASKGKLAKKYGKDGTPNDYMVQLLKIWEVVENNYTSQLSPDIREICDAYADGLNHYALLNPKKIVRGLFPVAGKDIVAGFVHRTPLMFGLDDVLSKLASNNELTIAQNDVNFNNKPFDQTLLGSNVIAVSPNRSADGHTRIAINSHQPWSGPVAWYEAHLKSNEGLNIVGGLFPGSPVVFVGHNQNLGWSHTVNQPDLIDVYELQIHPENKNKYLFQGRWEELEVSKAILPVKIFGPLSWKFKKEILWSVHGPVIRNDSGTFAIRYSGYGEIRQVEQWFRMNKSKNLNDFVNAMEMLALPMFNTLYADKDGNIYYVYNALLPIRGSDSYNWNGIIQGTTARALWRGYFSFDQLPQILNPESGFLQNCNSTPFLATDGADNPDKSFFPQNLGIELFQTNRALRAHETFGKDKSITREEFYSYKFDTKYSTKSVMAVNLKRFLNEASSNDADILKALSILKNWNLDTDSTNIAMHLAYDAIQPHFEPKKYKYDYNQIMDRLIKSVQWSKKYYGDVEIKWGDILRLKRGKTDLGLSGGPDILRAVYSKKDGGKRIGTAGDCYFQIVEWDKKGNVSAQSIHQYGSATLDSSSIHYDDQAKLFATHQMKPVLMNLEDIKLNSTKIYKPGEK